MKETKVGDDALDRAGDLPSKASHYTHIPFWWPSTKLYVATGAEQSRGEQCFVPFGPQDGPIPIGEFACSSLSLPLGNGNYEFSGQLDKKCFYQPVSQKDGDRFTGYYRDLRHPQQLTQVAGTFTEDGKFAMRALSESGVVTSPRFRGSVTKGKILGQWISPSNSLRLPFFLNMQGFS